MKTINYYSHRIAFWLPLAASAWLISVALNTSAAQPRVIVADTKAEEADSSDEKQEKRKKLVIESIEKEGKEAKEVAWLGVSTEEASEALAAQLDLSSGEGLVVNFVADDSPADKAGLKKHDVLVELDGQMLVHPHQLRKLVRMHKQGDKVKLTVYRAGKKETISATLGKTMERVGWVPEVPAMPVEFRDLGKDLKLYIGNDVQEQLKEQMKHLHEQLAQAGVNRDQLQLEIKRSLEQAHKGVAEALHQTHRLAPAAKEIEEIVRRGVDLDKDATVIVRSDRKSVKTVVKADDSGTYVIVASPKKRLTAHDKDGKLLFDGNIDTTEQQGKVPSEIWDKVQPMLDKLDARKSELPEEE